MAKKQRAVGTTVKHQAAKRAGGLVQKRATLVTVHRNQVGKVHSHFCSDRECRTYYEDSCSTPETNGRCQPCRGQRRTWIDRETGLHAHDPRPCCTDNTVLISDSETLEKHDLAGPGPWFMCQTCRRAHGWPCTTT